MDFNISATTDVGIRRKINQDRIFAERVESPYGPMAFAVVCDGMGGLEHGEVASTALVQAFSHWAADFCTGLAGEGIADCVIRSQWTAVVERIHAWILEYSRKNGCKMGSTVTALLLTGKRYYLMNIGDSRAYEITPQGICQLTVDHTVVQQEVEKGNLTREQAESAPMGNVLTRCVGIGGDAYPDLFFGDTKEGAIYLLCSDGFRHHISESEIVEYICGSDRGIGMEGRQKLLIALGKQRGETDNISVITIQCIGSSPVNLFDKGV